MDSDSSHFYELCKLFEVLHSITKEANLKRINNASEEESSMYLTKTMKIQVHKSISEWFSRFTSGSLCSIFRLLVPEEDVLRVYYLKEKRLSTQLVSVFSLSNSKRAKELLDWKNHESGDLSQVVFNLVSECEHAISPNLTISQVDSLLNKLSATGMESLGKDTVRMNQILRDLYLSMTSTECKWITRLILKSPMLCIDPKFYFDAFHGWMWKVYQIKNELQKTCQVISEIIRDGHKTSSNTDVSFSSIAKKYFQPELGTNIAVMECGRGKGVDHVASQLKDKVCYIETKYDGERLQAHFNSSWNSETRFKIYSKSGRNSTFNRRLCQQQLFDAIGPNVKNFIVEGELLVFNEINCKIEPFGTVQDLGRREFREKGILLGRRHFLVILYDILYLNDECLMRRPLNERKRLLALNIIERPNFVQISPISIIDLRPSLWYSSLETFRQLYLECLDRNEEGLIIKNADSFYIPGDRHHWWKLKKDYIEGFGDTADFAVIAAFKTRNSGGLLNEFVVACMTNKSELENDPIGVPNFQAIFTVSLGLTKAELELLQAILEARKAMDQSQVHYNYQFARGFAPSEKIDLWLREPVVFELLGSGLVRERGMWCYSLRFPRIKSIKLGQVFMNCISFQELQEMGKDSISTNENTSGAVKPNKRVRFVFEAEDQPVKYLKSDFYFHLSKRIGLKEREVMESWLDCRGFELIWSIEAALTHSNRKLVTITSDASDKSVFHSSKLQTTLFIILESTTTLDNYIKLEGLYFWLVNQGCTK